MRQQMRFQLDLWAFLHAEHFLQLIEFILSMQLGYIGFPRLLFLFH